MEDGAWRSLVAHLLWEQGVGGSNPLAPTTSDLFARLSQLMAGDRICRLGSRERDEYSRL